VAADGIFLAIPEEPRAGIRLAVKDLLDTAGLTTTYGSAVFAEHMPSTTAESVRLAEAGGYANVGNYPPVLRATGLYFSQAIIWDKQHPVLTRKDFMGAHEWCFYGWKLGAAHQFFGPNNATDLWAIKKVNPQSMIHLTEKPVELATRAMEYSSKPGENVLDLFGGSGSTLILAVD